MKRIWWLILNISVINLIHAAPREYSLDELITEPRPGEEYVNIQTTSKGKVDLKENAFTTSHRGPEQSKTNVTQEFQTSHKIPPHVTRPGRSISVEANSDPGEKKSAEAGVAYLAAEVTTAEPPSERVVTKTSIKMSKSKKVQKSILKPGQDGFIDIKAENGVIDMSANADEIEEDIMKKKFTKKEMVESNTSESSFPLRFNVPLEDDVKNIAHDKELLIPNPVLATTQEPPITTFNYKNVYQNGRGIFALIPESEKNKSRYQTISVGESIKTAESKIVVPKKDENSQEKENYRKNEAGQKDNSDFYILSVNKQSSKLNNDNIDFVDIDEKVLLPAGSSPSQSSKINIKKGPNGQDYEYEYVYYYYDEDEDENSAPGETSSKDGKISSPTTEEVYNGHDGPAKDEREDNVIQSVSTSGNKYLPTEAPKSLTKSNKKYRTEESDVIKNETAPQSSSSKSTKVENSSRFTTSTNKQQEINEVLPTSGRSGFRPRGRSTTTTTEEIPSIGEERLPSNTRFPPRSRAKSASHTPPQPQELTTRNKNRESSQSRFRIPNSSLLDSSSFRTHSSDASFDEDSGYDAEVQKKSYTRGQSGFSSRRGSRPITTVQTENTENGEGSRRPVIRKQLEDKKARVSRIKEEEAIQGTEKTVKDKHLKPSPEDNLNVENDSLDNEKLKLPIVEQEPNSKISTEIQKTSPQVPLRENPVNELEQHTVKFGGQEFYPGAQVTNEQQSISDQQIYRHSVSGQTIAEQSVAGQSIAGHSVAGQSIAGQSVAGQSVAGQSIAGQSVAGQSVAGQSIAGHSVAGQSVAGQSDAGQSIAGHSVAGQSVAGQSVAGQSAAGQSVAGQSIAGHSVAGQSVAGQSVVGQLVAGQSVAGQSVAGQSVGGQPLSEISELNYQTRPEVVDEHAAIKEGSFFPTLTQNYNYQGPVKTIDSSTESTVGLTSAMMEKVALDLYAILQQAQNENIRTNFIDGNSTDITTDRPTEYTTYDDGPTVELSNTVTTLTTTTTTTTTTTPASTSEITTTSKPTQALGRGRYRGRASVGKARSKTPLTTTEAPEEVTSSKPRGRFPGSNGSNSRRPTFARKSGKPPVVKEPSSQDDSANEETSKPVEKQFGERPRNRVRSPGKTTANLSASAPTVATSLPASSGRTLSNDRFNARRKGATRGVLSSAQQTTGEETTEEEKQEGHQENGSNSVNEGISHSTVSRPNRLKIGSGSVRPLRPGPRSPLLLSQRSSPNAASTTTQLPDEYDNSEKEVVKGQEVQTLQQNEENSETQTSQPVDALTRLKSRPRLRVGTTSNQKVQSPVSSPVNRRKLVSSLLPKRKPNEEKLVSKVEEEEGEKIVEVPVEEEQPTAPEETINVTTEAEVKGLTGLLNGRRNLNRRPGTIYSRNQAS